MSLRTGIASAVFLTVISCGGAPAAPDITGRWDGSLLVQGMELEISVEFTRYEEGLSATIDIPVQGAFGLPLTDLRLAGDSIYFTLPSNLGPASFAGAAGEDGIAGTFTQGMASGTFELSRAHAPMTGDLPYRVEEVEVAVEGWTYRGTLTVPEGDGPFPGVVMLTGSGIQDRNENVFGFEVFAVLADSLARQGVASLRCDDRGFGAEPWALEGVTDSVLAGDALALLARLESSDGVDGSRTGFLGHSEGSNIALRAAALEGAGSGVDFVVSMAGPAAPGYDILLGQVEIYAVMSGTPPEEVDSLVALQRLLMDTVLSGGDVEAMRAILEEQTRNELAKLPQEQLAALGDIDAFVENSVSQTMSTMQSPWFADFLTEDPAARAASLECPVLALYGEIDTQVSTTLNEPRMRAATAGVEGSEVVVIQGANHLFQEGIDGSFEEYAHLERAFVPGFTGMISDWIRAR